MNIRHLVLKNVGPLADVDLQLDAPGLNVIVGPNESGKSTLCESISAIVYGYPRGAAADRRAWGADEFYGLVAIEVDGRSYLIERQLASDDTRIIRLGDDGEEEIFSGNANPRGRTEEPQAYRRLLAEELHLPSEAVLRNSAYVGQLAVEVRLDEELRRQISGAGQADYKRAEDYLRDVYYALTSTPLPGDRARSRGRRIEELRDQLEDLRSRLDTSRDVSRQLAERAAEVDRLKAERGTAEAEAQALGDEVGALEEYLELQKKREGVARQEKAARTHAQNAATLKGRLADLQRDEASELYGPLRSLQARELAQLRTYVSSDAESTLAQIRRIEVQESDLQADLASQRFAAFLGVPEDTGSRLTQLVVGEKAAAQLEGAASPGGRHPQARGGAGRPGAAGIPVGAGVLGVALGALVAILLHLPFGAILASALGLGLFGALAGLVITLAARANERRAETQQIEAATRLQDARKTVEALRAQLGPILAAGGGATAEVLLERWTDWAARKADLRGLAEKRGVLAGREVLRIRENPRIRELVDAAGSAVLKDRLAAYDRIREETSLIQGHLAGSLAAADSVSGELDGIASDLQETVLRLQALEKARPTLGSYRENRSAGLERMEEKKGQLSRLKERLGDLDKSLHQAEIQVATLHGQPSGDPASLVEEIDDRETSLQRLELRCRALTLAATTLQEAIAEYERDHISRLSERASTYFARLTRERYTSALVKPEGELKVCRPGHDPFGIALLSAGARDQLYLALRLAVTDLLAADVQLPLLLDDSFVNFDDERLAAAKRIVQEIATQRQVILLTHSPEYRAWGSRTVQLASGAQFGLGAGYGIVPATQASAMDLEGPLDEPRTAGQAGGDPSLPR